MLYAILDRVVDDYQPVIGLDEDIKEVETEVFSPPAATTAERIYLLKREVIEFHQAAAPSPSRSTAWSTAWSRACTASWASTSATSRTTCSGWSTP